MDPSRPAEDVWNIKRKPVDILGRLMIRLDFQLRGWEVTIHHKMCETVEEADAECHKLAHDLRFMADGAFRQKYRIAHDLLGGF
ncbi:MAG TPA: hypothetical protein VGM37_04340 [Armatimonadota bacterium]|jgi:hypothetical protein